MRTIIALLVDDPDDEAQLMVHADWLTQQGDPRGELIAVQLALAKHPTPELLEAEERLLRDQRVSPFSKTTGREIDWRGGLIRSARIIGGDTSGLARLIRHPSARWLRRLWIENDDVRDHLAVLRDGPDLPLHQLVVLARPHYEACEIDLRKYERLEQFEIEGNMLVSDWIPPLRRLHLRTDSLFPRTLQAIADADLSRLEELEAQIDDMTDGRSTILLDNLITRRDLGALRTLRIINPHGTLTERLVRSSLVDQLELLDLGQCNLTGPVQDLLVERGLRATLIVDGRDALPLRTAYGTRIRVERVARPFATWRE